MSAFAILRLIRPFSSQSFELEDIAQKDGISGSDSHRGVTSAEGGDAQDTVGTRRNTHKTHRGKKNLCHGCLEPGVEGMEERGKQNERKRQEEKQGKEKQGKELVS